MKMETRSRSAAKKRTRDILDEEGENQFELIANPDFNVNSLLEGLTFSKDGKYVVLDSKLIKRLCPDTETEPEEPARPNPFAHVPEFLDVMKSEKSLTSEFLNECSESFHGNKNSKNMAEMIGNLPIDWLALRRSQLKEDDWEYNVKASVTPRVTNQLHSGRCWIFSFLNAIRYGTIKKLDLETKFEFSAAYLFFYDKWERANFLLESMWSLRDRELDDRYVRIFTAPETYMSDGGLWNYAYNLANKYGLVPKSVYGDSYNCMVSDYMNNILQLVLNRWALEIFNNKDTWSRETFEVKKKKWNSIIYDLLVKFMGEPPKSDQKFNWVFQDARGERKVLKETPKTFYSRVVPHNNETKVVVIHDPRHEYYKTHLLEYGNNMVGGIPANFLNLPMKDFKRVVAESLNNDECVWMGTDVGKCMDPEDNTLDTKRFDYEAVLGTQIFFDKKDMLEMMVSGGTHAMVFCGVDIDDTDPENPIYKKWRIENSWGMDVEMEWAKDHGYWRMTDDHFEKFTYMAVVDLKYFDEDIAQKMLENKNDVVVYKPWDSFGGVAFNGACSHCKKPKTFKKHN